MNLFLLVCVPLAALALHLYLRRPHPLTVAPWAWGSVAALGSLILASFWGGARTFNGDLGQGFLGLSFTDVVLVPGIVVGVWMWLRRDSEVDELRLWLALVFTLAGVRDFAATDRTFDLWELFLVPLDRVLIVVTLPLLASLARTPGWKGPVGYASGVAVLFTGSLFPVLSFAGWGWLVWLLALGGIALGVFFEKKAAPRGSGPMENEGTTGAGSPTQP